MSTASIAARLERLPSSRPIWALVVLLSLGGFFEFYDFMMTAYISPGLVKAGVFHEGKAGLFGLADQASFAAATFLGLFLGTLVFSRVADRFGRRAIFTGSLLWYTAATVMMATQSNAVGIDLWRLVAGIGIGVELVTIDAYLAELVPGSIRGRAFAISQCIQFLGVPTVALACWALLAHSPLDIAGWRWVMLLGAVGALAVWLLRLGVPESPRWLAQRGRLAEAEAILLRLEGRVRVHHGALPVVPALAIAEEETGQRFLEIFGRRYRARTVMLVVFNIFQTVGFYGFGNWAPTFLAARGNGFTKTAEYSFIIAAAWPLGPLLWSFIAERLERKWLIVGAAATTAVLGLAFAALSGPVALVSLGVAITFSNNLLSFAYHAYQAELYPTRMRAKAVGFVYSWSRLSTVFSSYIIAWLLGAAGVGAVFAFIALAMLVVIVTIGVFGPRTRGRALEEIAG